MSRTTTTCLLLMLSCSLSACAFFGKSEPLEPRFYSAATTESERASASAQTGLALRVGRVLAGGHLQERIAYRSGQRELGFYDQRRWTERPEVYVRRAVSHALFDQRGVVRVVSGPAALLELELLEFVELRAPKRAARVSISAALSDGRTVRLERTFSHEQALPKSDDDEFGGVAEAMSLALQACADELADAVVSELSRQPVSTADAGVAPLPEPGAAR